MSTLIARITALVAVIALTACNAGPLGGAPTASPSATQDDAATDRPAPTVPPIGTVPPATGEPVTGEVPQDLMDEIRDDAAERLDVEPSALETVRAEAVTWPDGALGCPEPGQVYTQALVDGYHVVLTDGEEELDYRATAEGSFRLCENPGPPGGDR